MISSERAVDSRRELYVEPLIHEEKIKKFAPGAKRQWCVALVVVAVGGKRVGRVVRASTSAKVDGGKTQQRWHELVLAVVIIISFFFFSNFFSFITIIYFFDYTFLLRSFFSMKTTKIIVSFFFFFIFIFSMVDQRSSESDV